VGADILRTTAEMLTQGIEACGAPQIDHIDSVTEGWVICILELVPIDPDIHEIEHVAHEDGPERNQHPEIGAVRDFEFQHHDGDDDGDDAVAEGP
jgi:hypothetical protein